MSLQWRFSVLSWTGSELYPQIVVVYATKHSLFSSLRDAEPCVLSTPISLRPDGSWKPFLDVVFVFCGWMPFVDGVVYAFVGWATAKEAASWPFIGNHFQLGKKPNESLLHLATKYGPLMTLQLGMRTTVVVSSPAMAKEVLKTNDRIFAGRTVMQVVKCLSFNESSLSMGQYGSRWRMLRTLCTTQLFSSKRLEALRHLRRDEVFQTMKLIFEDSVNGKHVNIGHMAFLTVLNLLGNMIFTQSIFHSHSRDSEQFKDTVWRVMEVAGAPNLADFFPFLRILDPQGLSRQYTTYLKRMYEFFDKFIEDRLATAVNKSDSEKDFLDVLLDFRSDEFTLTDIRAFLFEIFMAGSETISTTLEWAMAELIRNPHTMKRAQQELEEVVGRQRRVEESDIEHLPYLRAVVKEVFRMHTPLPLLLPHRAERSCDIGGFVIPKHAQIIVNVWGMGRNPSIWNDPSEFLPDRFLHSGTDYKGQNFELIPFGTGRRICVGLPLADRMVHLVLASLLHSFHFEWRLPDGMSAEHMDMTDKFGITLQKAVPLDAIPTPRPLLTSLLLLALPFVFMELRNNPRMAQNLGK